MARASLAILLLAIVLIPDSALAQCERWLLRDNVTRIEPDQIRFGVQGGALVSADAAEAAAAIVEAAKAMAADVELHICVPNGGQLVIHAAAAARPL